MAQLVPLADAEPWGVVWILLLPVVVAVVLALIAQHVIPPALEEANHQRAKAGLPAIRDQVTPHTLRYTCIASLFAAGADQDYVAAQVGHEDVTTTNRIYRYVLQRRQRGEIGRRRQLAMRESAAEISRPELFSHDAKGR